MKIKRPELDKYLAVTAEKSMRGACDGSCDQHTGEVSVVRVYDKKDGFDWGYFSYCESAKAEDISRGMELESA